MPFEFNSRRSPVLATHGMVAASEPLAVIAGIDILKQGGNAADAAVATAAALNVTEPHMTGVGGDVFVLHYDAATRQVTALNGSGRAPAALTLDLVDAQKLGAGDKIRDAHHPYCVTVPGACAAWCDLLARHGSMSMADVLAPAIELAEQGFPVSPLTARGWRNGAANLLNKSWNGAELTINGRAPREGEIWKNPGLARSMRLIAEGGKDAYYRGAIGRAVVDALQQAGGVMTRDDLATHESTWVEPISTTYRGVRVWECPPNGQGLAALIALNIIEGFDLKGMAPLGVERMHLLIEAMRIAFADTAWYVADPAVAPAPLEQLISKQYANARRELIDRTRATIDTRRGAPAAGQNTVYFCVVDGAGHAVSFINSNYGAWGSGIVPKGCGFVLQNRGHGFVLDPAHPNALAPGKRPYHTIIPGMLTREADNSLYGPFGVKGTFMQPQGHVQVVVGMIDDGLDPQAALDRPRFRLTEAKPDSDVRLEEGVPFETMSTLAQMGHHVVPIGGYARTETGTGQIIRREPDGVLWGGSDPRADGCAIGY